MSAIQIELTAFGDAARLHAASQMIPQPQFGEIVVQHTAIGVNFIDIYQRTGLYPLPLPAVLGKEAAGKIVAIGDNVTEFKIGDRVAYGTSVHGGGYASYNNIPAEIAVPIPADVSDEDAAALMLQGMTAYYLLHQTYAVQAGQTILVHAAAGGVGLLLGQWAHALGVKAIGTVSSAAKAELAKAHGYTGIINYSEEDITARVKALTNGAGVPVVYDGVGQSTFQASLDSLSPRGMLVSFGQASGLVPPFDLRELSKRGSLAITRPSLFDYTRTRADLLRAAGAVFTAAQQGILKPLIGKRYALTDVGAAHTALETRQTTGKILLIP